MRLVFERGRLLGALNHIHRVVERRTSVPILSHVLFEIQEPIGPDSLIALRATDLDLEITETVCAEADSTGSLTLPAHTLYDIVRKFSDGAQIIIEQNPDDSQAVICSGRSRFTLPCLRGEDFPKLVASTLSHQITLSAGDLKVLIDRTQFAISTDETRYYLNGIFLHRIEREGGAVLRAVATDAHRLAYMEIPAVAGTEDMPSVTLPRKTVAEVMRLLDASEGQIGIALSNNKITFKINQIQMTSKLVDGAFPDYERVVPAYHERRLRVDRDALQLAVDRVSIVAGDKTRSVRMSVSQGRLELTVTSPDMGTALEEIEVEYQDEDLVIGFNARYLMDILGHITSSNATILLNNPASPVIIKDENIDEFLYILMPMRLK